jgi:hypothetical protein
MLVFRSSSFPASSHRSGCYLGEEGREVVEDELSSQ